MSKEAKPKPAKKSGKEAKQKPAKKSGKADINNVQLILVCNNKFLFKKVGNFHNTLGGPMKDGEKPEAAIKRVYEQSTGEKWDTKGTDTFQFRTALVYTKKVAKCPKPAKGVNFTFAEVDIKTLKGYLEKPDKKFPLRPILISNLTENMKSLEAAAK